MDELSQRFYAAFDKHDGDAMAACYAADAHFWDPVFQDLSGREAGAMWRMLTGRAEDLRVELAEHSADGDTGSARWIAHYTFTQTGRPVVNEIRATFRFKDGLIADHRDEFDFTKWARQAIGLPGLLPPVHQRELRGCATPVRHERSGRARAHLARPWLPAVEHVVEQTGAARLGEEFRAEADQAARRHEVLHAHPAGAVVDHLLQARL